MNKLLYNPVIKTIAVCVIFGLTPQMVLANDQLNNQPKEQRAKIDIGNFECVSESIWRGAAPSDLAIHQLAESGIRTIIDLRMNKFSCRHEEQIAHQFGLNYIHLPLGFKSPRYVDVTEFLKIVNEPVNLPVYIHCHQGADRTGVLIGIYRILVENWTLEHTYKEMRLHHFKPWLLGMRRSIVAVAKKDSVRQTLQTAMGSSKVNIIDSSDIVALDHPG